MVQNVQTIAIEHGGRPHLPNQILFGVLLEFFLDPPFQILFRHARCSAFLLITVIQESAQGWWLLSSSFAVFSFFLSSLVLLRRRDHGRNDFGQVGSNVFGIVSGMYHDDHEIGWALQHGGNFHFKLDPLTPCLAGCVVRHNNGGG